jgi:methylated-DNA-protein-cysteine methyltransferase related protein
MAGEFARRVVALALAIPRGKVTTYGRIARAAGGGAMSSQSVTRILARAILPKGKFIPYHRIVYASGRVWIDEESKEERLLLYRREGIPIDAQFRVSDFVQYLHEYT